ncbi:MAG: septum formation inhibitor Maf [Nitrospirae bacterium]|nr:septum formation inhibitor Maf [Nitrospirota bacterium]
MTVSRKIVLASSSPRRKSLLNLIGLDFETDKSEFEEDIRAELSPYKLAQFLSKEKALSVAYKHKNSIIIAADTFIEFKGKILGKPHTAQTAEKMLRLLSGNKHKVITGFTVLDTKNNRLVSKSVATMVSFRKLAPKQIKAYIRSKEPLDKAGAYAIQGLGALLIEKISGDYYNVVGLPIAKLAEVLQEFGVDVWRKNNV